MPVALNLTCLTNQPNTVQVLNEYHQENLVPSQSQEAAGYKSLPVHILSLNIFGSDLLLIAYKIFGLGPFRPILTINSQVHVSCTSPPYTNTALKPGLVELTEILFQYREVVTVYIHISSLLSIACSSVSQKLIKA